MPFNRLLPTPEGSKKAAGGRRPPGRPSAPRSRKGRRGAQTSTMAYDARGRQTSVVHRKASGTWVDEDAYVWDGAGNLTQRVWGSSTTDYAYDAADQLLTEIGPGYSASYAYDANGNRASKTLGGTTQTYSVDDGDKLTAVTQGGTTLKSYAYDAAGRTKTVVSSAGTTTLGYDYESRVTGIAYPGGATNSFSYNGLDARVGKVDSAGTATYRRDGADVTDEVLSDGSAVYTGSVSQRRSGATTYAMANWRGDAARQTNNTGGTTAYRAYDAFGVRTINNLTPVGPFGYAASSGYQGDEDSGLMLLGHRYYDPSTGRFLTRDPIKDGRNWYGYCGNNPLRSVDTDGLKPRLNNPGKFVNRTKHPVRVVFDHDTTERGGKGHQYYIDVPPGYETIGIDADWVRTYEPSPNNPGYWEHIKGGDTMVGSPNFRGGDAMMQPLPVRLIPDEWMDVPWHGPGTWPPRYDPPLPWPGILNPPIRPIPKK